MNKYFLKNVRVTSPFFLVRLACAFLVSFFYILLAAFVQDVIVKVLGESTFNYIVAGVMSLFIGIWFCYFVGALLFMFVKGWHVAALAYVSKIDKSGASALDVGIRAFSKNLISFGAVYGIRIVLKNVVKDFKDKIWTLSADIPYASTLKNVADNPIVEYIASDVLHYAFDATVFYLVKHPAEDANDVPSVVFNALQKYLYCLPSILISSVQTYVFFRFIPKLIKWLVVFYVFFTQGIVAGLLISVLMLPIFYILDNAFFDPLTMMVFISVYAKQCDKPVDENSPVVQAVNAILSGMEIGTSGKDLEAEDEDEEQEQEKSVTPSVKQPRSVAKDKVQVVSQSLPSDDDLFGEPEGSVQQASMGGALDALSRMTPETQGFRVTRGSDIDLEGVPLDGEDEEEVVQTEPVSPRSTSSLSDLFKSLRGGDLDDDPLQGMYIDPPDDPPRDRAQSFLSGDEDDLV